MGRVAARIVADPASQPPRRGGPRACSRVAATGRVASGHGCGSRDRQRRRARERRAPRASRSRAGGSSRSAVTRSRMARGRRSMPGAGSSCPASTTAHIHLLSGAREANGALLYPLETVGRGPGGDPRATRTRTRTSRGSSAAAGCTRPFPGAMPTAAQLDEVIPDRPAWMGCFDGHTGWANTARDAPGGHRSRDARPAGRRHRPGRRWQRDRRVQGGRPDADRRRRPAAERGRGPGLGPARASRASTPAGSPPRRTRRSTPTSSPSGGGSTTPASWPSGSAAR